MEEGLGIKKRSKSGKISGASRSPGEAAHDVIGSVMRGLERKDSISSQSSEVGRFIL